MRENDRRDAYPTLACVSSRESIPREGTIFFDDSAVNSGVNEASNSGASHGTAAIVTERYEAPVGSKELLAGPLQRLCMTDQPIETVEAQSLLLFGFCAQLRSPVTDFRRQDRLSKSQFPTPLSCSGCFDQSVQSLSESACLTPGPLRSFRLSPVLFTTMGPSDSRP
jgi:hypothetical protein